MSYFKNPVTIEMTLEDWYWLLGLITSVTHGQTNEVIEHIQETVERARNPRL